MKKSHERVEKALIDAFLKGNPAHGAALQSERDLAEQYSVSRTTVREALQHLQQSSWITVNQRHATIVNDFWSDGDLELLSSIARNTESFPMELAANLLELRVQFAPDYARRAVENDSSQVIACLARARKLGDHSGAVAKFDWELHKTMAILSGNKIYPLLLNSFAKLYFRLRGQFFADDEFRVLARGFYQKLMHAAIEEDGQQAEEITRSAMKQRLHVFRRQAELVGKS